MNFLKKAKKSPVAMAAVGTVIGGVGLGLLFVYRNSFRNVPVVGPVVDNAANGLNGSSLARNIL
ncbi:MAG: hypothetical protein AAFY83_11710 [Pseudomonadota bacterium]